MDAASQLLAKSPPADLEKNLKGLKELLLESNTTSPDIISKLEKKHVLPFQVIDCDQDGEKPFLICSYNCVDGDKHRSPWTNQLHPPKSPKDGDDDEAGDNKEEEEEEFGEDLRIFEANLNDVWDSYKNLYYGHEAVGSVYLKKDTTTAAQVDDDCDNGSKAFEGMFGIQKNTESGSSWHSVSFVHVGEPTEKDCPYTVETSVWLMLQPSLTTDDSTPTKEDISLSVSKKVTKVCKIAPDKLPLKMSHTEHIGAIIEANEIDLRSNLEKVLIPKNQEILDAIQKAQEPSITRRPQINPLMGMVMNSDLLKKKLAKQHQAEAAAAAAEKSEE